MKKIILIALSAIAILLLGVCWFFYNELTLKASVPKDLEDPYVIIPTNASYEEVIQILQDRNMISNPPMFDQLADRMKYRRDPMRSGRFKVQEGWSMVDLIRHLRNGKQAPVDVVLTNERLLEDVAAKVARFIEPDSASMIATFLDPNLLQEMGYTPETLMSLFIPNTYEFFWNTTPQSFLERMQKEHDAFWEKDNRLAKAKALDMTPAEVYTLAAIVEKETLQTAEKKRMAGVYLNRLKTGMRLQADPTSVFATRDFDTKRVTNYHTGFDSPYNTYIYKGLPPGPIAMASISSIDGVLNAEPHDYVYFCAKGDGSGFHNFAKSLSAHNRNAATYRANLRKRGLR